MLAAEQLSKITNGKYFRSGIGGVGVARAQSTNVTTLHTLAFR